MSNHWIEHWVLVVSYMDRSGLRHVWGPFPSEARAKVVGETLRDIGLDGLFEPMLLRRMVPTEPEVPHG